MNAAKMLVVAAFNISELLSLNQQGGGEMLNYFPTSD